MKKFRFTLQAVRTLRQRAEQVALEHYAQALLAHRQALDKLEAVQRELQSLWAQWQEKLSGGLPAIQLAQLQAYVRTVQERQQEGEKAVAASLRRVNHQSKELLRARQQREVVERHFEQRKQRYDRELEAAEQKLLDELAGQGGLAQTLLNCQPHNAWN